MGQSGEWATQINFYLWVPEDRRNYGAFGFTATEDGSRELMRSAQMVADGELLSRTYRLPETTMEDVSHVGGGMVSWAKQLVLRKRSDGGKMMRIEWSAAEQSVEFHVSPEGLPSFLEALEHISAHRGDEVISIECNGKENVAFYWPCFGHQHPSADPVRRFPETL